MAARQRIFRVRRNYNQWVNNQTLEDYALRFTAKKARRWSLARVANTALGAISFLALEAIGGAATLNYGFDNTLAAVVTVSLAIFLTGIPICYYAARYGVDIDLLTRGAGFGYIGSTITSLIYASFTFIFFALEAAIMAMALQLLLGLPLIFGYVVCSLAVIPLVTHGITFISRFQLWTQPLWIFLQLLPFVCIALFDAPLISAWTQFDGAPPADKGELNLLYFGAAASVMFSLIAQIGEQVDYLRFLPEKTRANHWRWWLALLSAGPGWIVLGAIKILAGSFLAFLALQHGIGRDLASDPARMYMIAFNYVTQSPQAALVIGGIFVIICQLKINVTNSYAGSIAWSNFFSRLTHSHPGRVVWLVFNVAIALMLMELGIYQAFEKALGVYAIVAISWVGALVADLVVNKPLGLSPSYIEFKRAHLYDINPVGVGATLAASVAGIWCHMGLVGSTAQALAHFVALGIAFTLAPTIAVITGGRYYIAREPHTIASDRADIECCICQNAYEPEDMAICPAYDGPICSLCCSLDARCQDSCKPVKKLPEQILSFFSQLLPLGIVKHVDRRVVQFLCLLLLVSGVTGSLLTMVYSNAITGQTHTDTLVAETLWKVFFILVIVAGVICWLFVLAHESRIVAQEESQRQNRLLVEEIGAHEQTDRQLQLAKEQAEAANNAKSRYLTGISHELRTPLNSILGYAQLLENDNAIPDSRRNQLGVIRRSGEHLADLIEGLLDISKIEAGRLDIHRDQVRIADLINQLVYMFRLQAEEKGLTFTYRCQSRLPDFVVTDEKRLRQILINLLSNAIKFTQKGTVDFTVRYRNQVAEMRVSDSGIGIPEEEMERIFQPFERLRRPGRPAVAGTGLGLTITRLLTDIMGGEITVGNNPGGGSTFTVWLMLSQVATPTAERQPARRVYGYHGVRKTITVVDDDPSHRGLISDILSPLGFSVLEAPDAQTCLAMFRQCAPDIYFLDITMPGMNGWNLAETLRINGYTGPIVMISADASEGNGKYRDHPFHNDYIVKPVKVTRVLDKLARHLHITWRYTPGIQTAIPGRDKRSFHNSEMPSPDIANRLINFAEIGHLTGLKETVSEMINNRQAGEDFIFHINQLVGDVKFDEIIRLLRGS